MRRLSQGRLSEIAGPLAIEADRTIRLIDLGRAVPGIIAGLPPATRAWADAFIRGLNHVVGTSPTPYEHRLLGIRPEPWTLPDFFTVARLVSADLTWLVGARLLRAQRRAGAAWPSIWPKLLAGGAPALMDLAGDAGGDLLARHMRAGSKSAAVAASRAANGAAMIASDPHLGLGLPNNWLIAGLRSPGIHAVGLMIPGMPFVALGRNEHVAWGGTSLHAASSEIIDVTGLPLTDRHPRRTGQNPELAPIRLRARRQ
jgi:penicillin amidase